MNEVPLTYGWRLVNPAGVAGEVIGEFLQPAVAAVPEALAARVGRCRIVLRAKFADAEVTSRWRRTEGAVEIELAASGIDPHDLALELLVCLGQVCWQCATGRERAAWLRLLDAELRANVPGEIDEDALEEKRRLLSSRVLARSSRRLEQYAEASFAGTAAEYVHALWHDVTVRSGPDHLPAEWLRRRLELLERWYPPGGGRRLFP